MDFQLTEEQKMFQAMVRDFATNVVKPEAAKIDEEGKFPAAIFKKAADLGLFGVTIDEKYGGSGGDYLSMTLCSEELARASGGMATIYLADLSLACYPIYKFGTEEQKKKYVAPIARGEKICCFALTEPGAGSDAGAMQATAVRQGDNWVLNGNKIFITNGAEASIAVVFAMEDKTKGNKGVSAFIVESDTPGYSVGKLEHKMGIHGSSTAELVFENCKIPAVNQLGESFRGLRYAMESIDSSRVTVAAQALGISQAAFDDALSYAQTRVQFGKTLAQQQAIQWMLADMATQIDAARMMVYRAAWLKDKGLPYMKEAAMAKLYAGEVSSFVTNKALQIHGGYGYCRDYPMERYLRDAKITEIYEGTSEMQRMTIARALTTQ
ncbi:MAG: acyl-CoA dehydrogenase [Dehalococcoidia bacterium]|nr:acyl-CoA dehydrogenase [Dehalococcoidia bacterium]MDD5494929.1 acyl-CoA dehydrogenase [Dehalococcoidia bacterium]